MSYTKKIVSSGAVQLSSGSGVIDLSANSHVSANVLQLGTALGMAYGGLGASYQNVGALRTGLGLAVGSDVQAYSAKLADIAGASPSSNQYVKYNGSNLVFSALPAGTDYNADESSITEANNVFSLKDDGITTLKLQDGSVTTAKLPDGAVVEAKLADDAVTNAKLADDAVGTAELINCSVTHAKLAHASVYGSKLDSSVASTGLSFNGGALQVDSAVVCMLSGDQQLDGSKSFSSPATFQADLSQQVSGQSGFESKKQFELQTTGNTVTTLGYFGIDVDSAEFVSADVTCCSDDLAECAQFKLNGVAKNNAGTSSAGQLNDEIVYRSNSNFTCVLDVDDTSDQVRIRVKGYTGINLRWHCSASVVSCPKYA